MNVSVIIPTYNRANDLKDALVSILKQNKPPKEVIIVDDSDDLRTSKMIESMREVFSYKRIALKYLRNTKERSITIARNMGIMHTTCEVVLFLDDDVILDKNYIREILKVYEKYPSAIGVQGYIKNFDHSWLTNLLNQAFFSFFLEKNKCRILPSGGNTYPYPLTKIVNCQWLSGTNQSYKKTLFHQFKFDEKLKKGSIGEDLDLSYRIYKTYPKALYATPYATLSHKKTKTSRPGMKSKVYMKTAYSFYLFYKNINQTILNKLTFILSHLGRLIQELIGVFVKKDAQRLKLYSIKYLMDSYIFVLKHLKEIKEGELKFFDDFLDQLDQ